MATGISLGGSLQDQGVRMTRQRKLLFELIDGSQDHLNAEALFRLAKERDPKINRVTVYRTLKLLKQEGLVDELDLLHHEGDQHYYETRLKREHAHVHLGFADNQVQGWLRSAGLNALEPIHFPGRRIMTGIWRGEREIAHRAGRTTTLAQGALR